MKGKKVLYIGGFELPDKNAAAHRVIGIGKALRELGYEVDFLGISKLRDFSIDLISQSFSYESFKYWLRPYPNNTFEWIKYETSIKSIRKFLSKNKYDIIIIYNFPAIAAYKLLRYCKKNNIKIISDITEWYDYGKFSIRELIKHLDSELRMRYINKKMDGIICISKYLYDYYKNSNNNLIILPPLVDLQEKKWEHIKINEDHRVKLIYSGSPGLNKDKINLIIDSLLQIYNNNNQFRFDVVGITKNEYYKIYPEHISEEPLIEKFIVFHGRVPHTEALRLTKAADFSIFLRERTRANMAGFPTKFVESISCGIPVLTNKTSDLEKYLWVGKNGFWLSIDDKKRMIRELEEIINLPKSEIKRMKEFTRNLRIFDYRNYIEAVGNFMKNVIKGGETNVPR
jgi:glycosyltransferase involved in cell wall biosynthesis